MLVIISIILGILLAFAVDWYIPVSLTSYFAIVILAALDSIFGGFRSSIEKKFDYTIFVTGLVGNSAIAVFLMYIGQRLGADLYLAAVLVFGTRMFQNFAIIRRFYIKVLVDKRREKRFKAAREASKEGKTPEKQE